MLAISFPQFGLPRHPSPKVIKSNSQIHVFARFNQSNPSSSLLDYNVSKFSQKSPFSALLCAGWCFWGLPSGL